MNWTEAVAMMQEGFVMQRAGEQAFHKDGQILERGEEPCMLAHAWTVDEKPVLVFCGAISRKLFVPGSEHTGALDWEAA